DGCGTVFKLDKAGTLTVLHRFSGEDGVNPANLIRDAEGNLYGSTAFGGDFTCAPNDGCGTLFKLDNKGTLTTLHTFNGLDGKDPEGRLVRDPVGNLYGSTVAGGLYEAGAVFELDAAGTLTVLHSFSEADGGPPGYANLIRDGKGVLYGTTFGWE